MFVGGISMEELNRNLTEHQYKDLIEESFNMIQCIDANNKFIYVNRIWKEKLMYVDEEVESLSFFDIIHPDYIYPYEEVLQKAILQGRTNQVEMVFIAKNLTPVYVEESSLI